MSDRPQAGDLYIVVDEMPSGGTWGHPFSVDPDTWLVKVEPVYEAAHAVLYEGRHGDGVQTVTRETVVAAVDAALGGHR